MSLLPRRSIHATPVLILVAVITLLALPVSWSTRAPGSAVAPALVWAGGSPDETLAPHPTTSGTTTTTSKPTKPTVNAAVRPTSTDLSTTTIDSRQTDYRDAVSARTLWAILWRVSATLAVKF